MPADALLWRARPMSAIRNSLFNLLESLLGPLLFLITTPFFLQHLGTDHFGLWIMASALNGFSGILTFGAGEATVRFVSICLARNDPAALLRVVRTTWTISVLMGAVCIVLISLAAPLLVRHVFKIHVEDQHLAASVLIMASIGLAFRFMDGILVSIFQGHHRFDLTSRISIGCSCLGMLANVLLVCRGAGLMTVIVVSTATVSAQLALRAWVIRLRLIPTWRFLLPQGRMRPDLELLEYSGLSWLQSLSGLLLNQMDRFIVLSFLGTHALTIYGTCLQVCQLIHLVPSKMLAFLFPRFADLSARGESRDIILIYRKGMIVSAACAAFLAAPLIIGGDACFRLWLGPTLAREMAALAAPLATVFAIQASTIMPHYALTGSRFMRMTTVTAVSAGVMVSISTWLGVMAAGMLGAAWSRLAALPATLVSRVILFRQLFLRSTADALVTDSLPVACGLGLAWLLKIFLVPHLPVTLPGTITAALSGVLIGGAVWVVACWQNALPLRLAR